MVADETERFRLALTAVRFDPCDCAAGVAAQEANDHGNSQDVDLLASVARDLNRAHGGNDARRVETAVAGKC